MKDVKFGDEKQANAGIFCTTGLSPSNENPEVQVRVFKLFLLLPQEKYIKLR